MANQYVLGDLYLELRSVECLNKFGAFPILFTPYFFTAPP